MPYIGNTIRAADDYRLIDDISSGFNGSTTTFALQVAGSSPVPFPKSPQQVLISVNGVIQEPEPTGASGFNLVGTNIVFSSAPTNGHAFFGIIYATADYLNAGGNFPAGSLGAPSITFIGDENTGLFRKSGGSVGFVSDATEIANFDSNGITISSGNLILGDSAGASSDRVVLGASSDFSIYHNGSNSIIDNNTNDLVIRSDGDDLKLLAEDDIVLRDNDDSTNFIQCINGGAVELYHSGNKKFETTSTGSTVTGNLSVTGETTTTDVFLGDSILHTGDTNTKIRFSANDTVTVETGGSERFRVQDDKVMVSVDLKPDTDSARDLGTNTNRFANGYFDTLYGNGANITGITSITINGDIDNRVITASGNSSLDGNSGLLFNNGRLDVIQETSSSDTKVVISNSNTPGTGSLRVEFQHGTGNTEGTNRFRYGFVEGYRESGSNDGGLIFGTKPDNASAPTERLRISALGFITHKFTRDNSTTAEGLFINNQQNSTGNNASLIFSNDSGNRKKAAVSLIDTGDYGAGDLIFALDGADSGQVHLTNDEKMRITNSGNLGLGTSSPAQQLHIDGGTNDPQLLLQRSGAGDAPVDISGIQFKNSTNVLGSIRVRSIDINDGFLQFSAMNAGTFTERQRFSANKASVYIGRVGGEVSVASDNRTFSEGVGVTLAGGGEGGGSYNIFTADNTTTMYIGRQASDGNIIDFRQDGSNEGSISVSGSTVSYNGGHLSRWSQLSGISSTDKSARPTIYQGTVMSNLDELCSWSHPDVLYTEEDEKIDDIPDGKKVGDIKRAAYTEDNQQLNITKISDIEGDKDVAGVFWAWDDDDDEIVNDFYIAMTGDMVIRVAASTTVARGDLLISAGDGTAKPQADDIIRSSTIAKIISTNHTATYADGSKAYPCVLMAC